MENMNKKKSHFCVCSIDSEEEEKDAETKRERLQRAEVEKVVVRMTNFPHEIHPVRPPGIETLLHGGLSLHTHYR